MSRIAMVCLALTMCFANVQAQPAKEKPKNGVVTNEPGAFQGFTLVFPLQPKTTYLVDMQGKIVHQWESAYTPGQEAYLLENRHLLRPAKLKDGEAFFGGAGGGGRIQEFTWEGELVWDYKFHNTAQIQHHAITRMPNGNVLLIVWERKTAKQAIEAGVRPSAAGRGEMLVDSLVEIKPQGKTGGEIVWEWHLWDHLIQDQDKTKANYGDVARHPELVDVNYAWNAGFGGLVQFFAPPAPKGSDKGDDKSDAKTDAKKGPGKNDSLDKLKGIGYVGAGGGKNFGGFLPDWNHVNAVGYNAKLDQIVISVRSFDEIWIIDHSTTTEEAAGHTGGRYGKGGDLLYRWGNPKAYRAGTAADQRLFAQHDAHWIPEGLPGAGNIMIFSNGGGRPDGNYSSIDEIVPPVDSAGKYALAAGAKFGPDEPVWRYTASKKSDFFAPLMSGAQRLPNGNTLIATGFSGAIFEITPKGETVWNYIVPNDSTGPGGFGFPRPGGPGPGGPGKGPPPGGPGGFGPPGKFAESDRAVQLFPGFFAMVLRLAPDQQKELEAFEKDASAKLEKMLDEEQNKQLKQVRKTPSPPGGPSEIGKVLSSADQEYLKLTDDQKRELKSLQKEADATIDTVLKKEQKKQIEEMQGMAKGFAGGPPGFGGGMPGPFGRGMGGNAIFRAYRYGRDYPGLAGKELTPGKTIGAGQP